MKGLEKYILNESNVPRLKKVIVASGTKMAIGDNLKQALASLLSQDALNIEINRTDDIEGLIHSIIQSNKNLSESTKRNNWEMVGNDLSELQTLINSLEKLLEEEEKESEKVQDINQDTEMEVQNVEQNIATDE